MGIEKRPLKKRLTPGMVLGVYCYGQRVETVRTQSLYEGDRTRVITFLRCYLREEGQWQDITREVAGFLSLPFIGRIGRYPYTLRMVQPDPERDMGATLTRILGDMLHQDMGALEYWPLERCPEA